MTAKKSRNRSTRRPAKAASRPIHTWRALRPLLERWRRDGATLHVELRRPRAIDVVPIDFISGELIPGVAQKSSSRAGKVSTKFTGRLIFATHEDITIRRPSGAILVIDNYEVASLSDGRTLFQPL